MNHINKEEKLAAARKKLKEFQNQQLRSKENAVAEVPPQSNSLESQIAPTKPVPEMVLPFYDPIADKEVRVVDTASTNSLSNYFSRNENEAESSIFDPAKNAHGESLSASLPNATPNMTAAAFSSYFDGKTDSNFVSSVSSPEMTPFQHSEVGTLYPTITSLETDSKLDANTSNVSTMPSDKEVEKLKLELASAENKVENQKQSLQILTTDREDLQRKLQSAINDVRTFQDGIRSLQKQLDDTIVQRNQLNESIEQLNKFKADVTFREHSMEQNLNNLKEMNDELNRNLEIQNEKNTALQRKIDEIQSSNDMYTLKFQQLGVDVSNTHPLQSTNEECELWKNKYLEQEEQVRSLKFELEHTSGDNRKYIENLEKNVENLTIEVQETTEKNINLIEKLTLQTDHIGKLEKDLQKTYHQNNNQYQISELQKTNESLKVANEQSSKLVEELQAKLIEFEPFVKRSLELERELENVKSELINAGDLQNSLESNKVATSMAIAQNNKLKEEVEQLLSIVDSKNAEILSLTTMLEKEKKFGAEMKTMDQQLTSDVAINTEIIDHEVHGIESNGKANVEAMQHLQEKFKNVLEKMADLTDEKQQLEHLVMQLQSETETIEEYVALYQKQRTALQHRARDTDLKMERVIREKERLLNILHSILKTEKFDCNFVKRMVEENLSSDLSTELNNYETIVNNNFHVMQNDDRQIIEHLPSCRCCSSNKVIIV